jgi:hypothetical protein
MLGYGSFLYFSGTLGGALGVYQGMILAWFATNFMIGNFNVAVIITTAIVLLTRSDNYRLCSQHSQA